MPALIGARRIAVLGRAATYPPEAIALFRAMTVQPSDERKAVIAAFFRVARGRSYWSKLAYLYCLRAHDAQASKLNWIDPARFVLTESGTVTFVQDGGWAGDGVSGKLLTGVDPSVTADSKMTVNSSSIMAWVTDDVQSNSTATGYRMSSPASGSLIIPRSTTNLFVARCNASGSVTGTVATARGLSAVSRTGATSTKTYRDGALVATGPGAALAFPSGYSIAICGQDGTAQASYPLNVAFAAGGEGMTDQEMADIYTDAAALMQGVVDTMVFANFGDSHAGLGVLNYLGTAVGKTLSQIAMGVGGETLAQTEARVATAAASAASVIVLQTATNSIPTAVTAEEMKTSFTNIINTLRAAHKAIWLFTIPPRGNTQQSPSITNRQIRKLLEVNDWLRATYANVRGVKLIDTWSTVAEPITTPADNDEPWYRPGFSISSCAVTSQGNGYGPNTYAVLTHNGGEGASLGVTIVGGKVTALPGLTRGFNYSPATPPTVSIIDPDGLGSGAVAGAVRLGGAIGDYVILDGGSAVVDGSSISAPQGGALQHAAIVDAPAGAVIDTIVQRLGFGYSTQAVATVPAGTGVSITPVMVSPYMWKTPMTTGDTHEVAAGLQAEAALLVPVLAAA